MTGNILEQGSPPRLTEEMVARPLAGMEALSWRQNTHELSACSIRACGGPAAESSGSLVAISLYVAVLFGHLVIKLREVGGSTNYFEIIRASSQPPSFLLLGVPSFPPGAGQELKELKLPNTEKCWDELFFFSKHFIKKFLKHAEKLKELYIYHIYI